MREIEMLDSHSANEFMFTSEDLKTFTNNFNQKNLIGITQFGKLYRGQLQIQLSCSWSTTTQVRNVTVKIWDQKPESECLIREEVKLLTYSSLKGHPGLAKLIGYCCEEEVKGVVYDLDPLDALQNLMAKDYLNWLQRVDVVLELARLLDFIHSQEKQNLAFNFKQSNIVLDWECKPKLCGFELISNGTLTNLNNSYKCAHISGYFDPSFRGGRHWEMSSESNVYSFGETLLGIIAKRDSKPGKLERQNYNQVVDIWAKNEYKPNTSLVHETLQEDWGYSIEEGVKITELAMRCIEFFPSNRPSMKQVVQQLEGLQVAQRLSDVRPSKRKAKEIL